MLRKDFMLKLFIIVCALWASQGVADAIEKSFTARPVAGWMWAVSIQIAIATAVLMLLDKAAFGGAFGAACAATWGMRTFYFLRRLPGK